MASSLLFILIIMISFLWMIRSFLEQKKLSEMKTDFINNMTHEFKTPIATISLASEALKDADVHKSASRLERLATVISDENKRLEAQVERVLQMARLERGEFKLSREPVDLHATIEHAVENVSLLLAEKGGQLQTSLEATQPVLQADKVHLTNIIYNLLDNAIKYSDGQVDVRVRTFNDNGRLMVEIDDKGIGMTQEQQKRVFEKFYRVPTGNVHNVKGFGLGLSYVKTMSEAHGGSVSVCSTPGKGSTFTVVLPA
jgi:two-component system phosphate regulon sensor histidine kinase PhoR